MGQQSVTPSQVGEHLAKLLKERGTTAYQLAKATDLAPDFTKRLLTGEQILTADVAFVLGDFFRMSPLIWLDLQRSYHLAARDVEEVGKLLTA